MSETEVAPQEAPLTLPLQTVVDWVLSLLSRDPCLGALRCLRRVDRMFGSMRFRFAPTVDDCLSMMGELEGFLGGEREAAEVIGPSLITLRTWKRRRRMSIPSRRLVWVIWARVLHPETIQRLGDLVTWGKFCPVKVRQQRRRWRDLGATKGHWEEDGAGI